MRLTKMFLKTLREVPAEAEIASHILLLRTGMIRKLVSGVYGFMPLGYRALRKIEAIIREEMDEKGGQEILMSAVQPAELWKESGRWFVYGPELWRLKDRNGRDFCLGPTHEELFTDVVRNDVSSYRQLPLNLYQIQTKYRDEARPRFGLMRSREFIMKDAYSFDRDYEGLDRSYNEMYDAYEKIFTRCGLTFRAVEADTGAIGGKNSHEFTALSEVGESELVGQRNLCAGANKADHHTLNVNYGRDYKGDIVKDIKLLKEGDPCPVCGAPVKHARGIEVGQVFKLGTKYSESMGALFKDENMADRHIVMGCYGIGVTRTLAAIVEQHHDENGIIWPMAIAPYHVIITLVNPDDEEQKKVAEEIYKQLLDVKAEVLLDDRKERPGVKFKDADLLGIPIRITVGKRAFEGIVEYKLRRDAKKDELGVSEAVNRAIEIINKEK